MVGPNGDFYLFPCNKWLDVSEDDGKIERKLHSENIGFETEKKSSRERLNEPSFDGNVFEIFIYNQSLYY